MLSDQKFSCAYLIKVFKCCLIATLYFKIYSIKNEIIIILKLLRKGQFSYGRDKLNIYKNKF